MSFEDKTLTCRDCGRNFTWSAGEQEFYAQKGLMNIPSRCPECRKSRRSNQGSTSSSAASERSNSGPRVQHPVTCASCGKETTVPFVPKYDRPVFCSDCFDRARAGNSRVGARNYRS